MVKETEREREMFEKYDKCVYEVKKNKRLQNL